MSLSPPSITETDDLLVVEAATAEAALEVIAGRLGPRARISSVDRVRRGGVAGFFAKELIQVTAVSGKHVAPTEADGDFDADVEHGVDGARGAERGPDVKAAHWPDDDDDTAQLHPVDTLLAGLDGDGPFADALRRSMSRANGAPLPHANGTGATRGGASASQPVDSPAAVNGSTPAVNGSSAHAGGHGDRVQGHAARSARARDVATDSGAAVNGRAHDQHNDDGPSTAQSQPASRFTRRGSRPSHGSPQRSTDPADAPSSDALLISAPHQGARRWSMDNLHRIGVGTLLTPDDITGIHPDDDIAWTALLARRVAPLCGPLPTAPAIVVGPAAARLARVLDLDVVHPGGATPAGSFAAPIGDTDDERAWLHSVRAGRLLHLVAGGPRWRGLLFDEPAVLSWTTDGLTDAVTIASLLSLNVGYATSYVGEPTRANPVDVAVAVRDLLPLHVGSERN